MTGHPLTLAAAAACALSLAAGAHAQATGGHDAHAGHGAAEGSVSTQAFRAANDAMHRAMDIEFTDDADVDFAAGMIGHHQGAIDMARIELEHGRDPQLRALAEEIIKAQEAEIEMLNGWLAEHAPN